DGLLAVVAAVGVNEQLGTISDRPARCGHAGQVSSLVAPPGLGDLHLDSGDALLHPAGQLAMLLVLIVGGKTTAAIDGDLATDGTEQPGQRHGVATGLEVPDGVVGGRKGEAGDAG